jgi:hypothetical protein
MDPEDFPAPPASLRVKPYPSLHYPALARGRGRAPRVPPLLSALLTKLPSTSLSLHIAESPGKPATPPVHHRHKSTPNPLSAHHHGHIPILYPTPPFGRFHSCIRAPQHPTTPLAQSLSLSRPLDLVARRRTPAPCYHIRTVGMTVSTPPDVRIPPKPVHLTCDTLAALRHRPSQPVDAQGATTAPAGHRGHRAR